MYLFEFWYEFLYNLHLQIVRGMDLILFPKSQVVASPFLSLTVN